jgi:hypothetical protein
MPRPRSFYERETKSTLPPPERREQSHVVQQGDSLIAIANRMYGRAEYEEDLWRMIAEANGVLDPFTFAEDFLGKRITIPAIPLPDFV